MDTQLSNVPKPVPPQLEENLVFSAERAQQFKTVDTHAVQVAKTEHNSFRDLIWDLIYDKNITDDLEKARYYLPTIYLPIVTIPVDSPVVSAQIPVAMCGHYSSS